MPVTNALRPDASHSAGPDEVVRHAHPSQGGAPYGERTLLRRPARGDVGVHGPGQEGVDPHRRSELAGQRDGEGVEPRLRAGVDDLAGRRTQRADRADVDDRSAARVGQVRPESRREPERALQVDRRDLVEVLLGDRLEAFMGRRHSCVVDQDVAAPVAAQHFVGQPVGVVPVRGVIGDGQAADAMGGVQLRRDGLAGGQLPAGDDHVRTRGCEAGRDAAPDAAAASGDDDDPTLELSVAGCGHDRSPVAKAAAARVRRGTSSVIMFSCGGTPALAFRA